MLVENLRSHNKNQKVIMYNGLLKSVNELVSGDLLMGLNSNSVKILKTEIKNTNLFTILPNKGNAFCVGENHKLTLVRNNRVEFRELYYKNKMNRFDFVDMNIADYLKLSNNKKKSYRLTKSSIEKFESEFNNLPVDPYMLGVLIGDGCLIKSIRLTTADFEVLQYFTKFAEINGLKLKKYDDINFGAVGERFIKNPIFQKFKELGVDIKCGNKFIPDIYKFSSIENRKQILAGLIDTDGSQFHNCFDYISKSKRLSEDVAFIAKSIGLCATVSECYKSCQTGFTGLYHRVAICGDCAIVPVKIERKKPNKRKANRNALYTNFSVSFHKNEECCEFLIGENEKYLLDDFTVV